MYTTAVSIEADSLQISSATRAKNSKHCLLLLLKKIHTKSRFFLQYQYTFSSLNTCIYKTFLFCWVFVISCGNQFKFKEHSTVLLHPPPHGPLMRHFVPCYLHSAQIYIWSCFLLFLSCPVCYFQIYWKGCTTVSLNG